MDVWRVGHAASPCDFTPQHLCAWNHRFNDQKREYRTIYAADEKKTCLREVLADLRPNKKVLADFEKTFGEDESLSSAGKVTGAWRKKHVLAQAEIKISSGAMSKIEQPSVLDDLSGRLKDELAERGHRRLDVGAIRSQDRDLTRAASRLLYDDGHCGISFRSRLDRTPCHALFEGRARLEQVGKSLPLTGAVPELLTVSKEYGLTLL